MAGGGLAGAGGLESAFVALIDRVDLSAGFVLTAFALAVVVGAVHGLRPGHGKSLAAAYLLGTQGRRRDAVAVGVAVAATHTLSVLVFGGVLIALTRSTAAAGASSTALTLVPALLVTVVGAVLVHRQVRLRRAQGPSGHGHEHAQPSRRGVLAVASVGGLAPSPAAFLVLATATVTGRIGFGIALVGAFSVGLAGSVIAAGVLVLRGRDLVARWGERGPRAARVAGLVPLLGSCGVLAAGVVATTLALVSP